MLLRILLPHETLLNRKAAKIVAEGGHGSFCLLPQHVDLVTNLIPGILSYELESGEEIFLAVDEGVLVKCGSEVSISVRNAVRGDSLETLQQTVREQFRSLDEQERRARAVLARLETSFVHNLMSLGG